MGRDHSSTPRSKPTSAIAAAFLVVTGRKLADARRHHLRAPGNLSARSIQLGTAIAPSLPQWLHRIRGLNENTGGAPGQASRVTLCCVRGRCRSDRLTTFRPPNPRPPSPRPSPRSNRAEVENGSTGRDQRRDRGRPGPTRE
jgi:hypothetical protein